MKSRLLILLCVATFSIFPLWAADSEATSASIEQRLRETDLAIALRQYERVRMEAFEARLQLDLLDSQAEMSQDERKKRWVLLDKRDAILRERAQEIRQSILKLGDEMAVAKTKQSR